MKRRGQRQSGAALIVALWTVLILSLLIGGLAYEMHIEAGITSHARKRMKAQIAARGGAEYAKFLLILSFNVSSLPPDPDNEDLWNWANNLAKGGKFGPSNITMGDSTAKLDIQPEASRKNVNRLDDCGWEDLLDRAGVPEEDRPELIDCFMDFTDENDEHRLNGAEEDDAYYKEQGYKPKNAPLDTVDELLLIKGFTPAIVYGGPPPDPKSEPLKGIINYLTTYGDGKININSASRDVLMQISIPPNCELLDEWVVDDILKYRLGDDGLPDTKDDGFDSVQDAISKTGMNPAFAEKFSVSDRQFVRVTSIGENHGVESGVWAVFEVGENKVTPIYWREEQMQ